MAPSLCFTVEHARSHGDLAEPLLHSAALSQVVAQECLSDHSRNVLLKDTFANFEIQGAMAPPRSSPSSSKVTPSLCFIVEHAHLLVLAQECLPNHLGGALLNNIFVNFALSREP